MQILLLSYFFPPYNIIASVRAGKTATYLHQFGHDVRVLTAQPLPYPVDLPVEFPTDRIFATRWFDISWPHTLATRFRGRGASVAGLVGGAQPLRSPYHLAIRLLDIYRILLAFPDDAIGWFPFGWAQGERLLKEWRPDIIVASSGPPTSLLIAAALRQRHGVPWVGELRDLWTDNHYYTFPMWRRVLETWLERRTLRTAAGLITVSEPLAQTLRLRYDVPVGVVLNGFDPTDYPPVRRSHPDRFLRIVYTGNVYPGKQSAVALFAALQRLGARAGQVRVAFYGWGVQGMVSIMAEAQHYGVASVLEVKDAVPHQEALGLQRAADVLLLLLWNDPRERGVYTGKLFEYLGARRPILAIGPADNVAAALIRERQAGIVSSDPAEIADHLACWLDMKERGADIPDLPESVAAGLSRQEQTRRLERFLLQIAGNPSVNRHNERIL
ncbi:MAG: glycosyltransferase [Roseiflexus sp.]|nr:glycosyltransferase [Roseiflexus sp.]